MQRDDKSENNVLCVVFFKIDIKMQPYTPAFYQNSYWFLIFAGCSLKMSYVPGINNTGHIMALICSIFYKLEQQIKQDSKKGSSLCNDGNLDIKSYGRSSDTFWYINQNKRCCTQHDRRTKRPKFRILFFFHWYHST